MKKYVFVYSAALMLSSILWAVSGSAEQVKSTGSLTGTVRLDGVVPEKERLTVDADTQACGKHAIYSETLIVDPQRKGIKDVLVTLKNTDKTKREIPKKPESAVLFDQKGCRFTDHLLIVPVGATVQFKNSDEVLHNVHTYSRKNTAFNEGIPAKGSLEKTFKYAERIKTACDAHKWMSAYIVVTDTPYFAVTNEKGEFAIPDVPPGTYRIQVWQEKLGVARGGQKEVDVVAGEESHVEYAMKMRKARTK